jgi:hypothetical protein
MMHGMLDESIAGTGILPRRATLQNYQFLVAQCTQQSTVEPDCSQNVIRCGKHETKE